MQKNPFNPNFGKVPPVFIDRGETVRELIEGLSDTGSPYQTTLISGVRGVGKTALLSDVCNEIRTDKKWIVADIPSNSNILETLVQTIHVKASSELRKALDSIDGVSVSILGVGFSYSAKDNKVNYQLLLEQMLEKMQENNTHLLVAIDEVTANKQVKLFASVYQIMVRRNYPISLVMTGLPKNISELQNDSVLTFLLRSARVDLPLLNKISVTYSYKRTFEDGGKQIATNVLNKMTALTNGYSYAFQLLGYLVWNTGADEITSETVDSVMETYKENLFRNAYFKIYEELSSVDKKFVDVMAMSEDTSVSMKYITEQMGKNAGYISTYRRRLIDSGVIQADSYGYVAFSLPLFDEYIKEFQIQSQI